MCEQVPVGDVVFDATIYPRSECSQATVDRYADALEAGAQFPPVTLESGTNRLFDGLHRLAAHKATGRGLIDATYAEIPDGVPAKAFTTSLGTRHGDPIRTADLRDNAREIFEQNPDLSFTAIAELWGITRQTVAKWVGDLHEQSRTLRHAKVLLLTRAGWTQKQIAAHVAVDRSTVSRVQIVNDLTFCIDPAVLRQAAMALPISGDVVDALLDEIALAQAENAERQIAEPPATAPVSDFGNPQPSPVSAPEPNVTPQQGPVTTAEADPAVPAETSASPLTPVGGDSAAAGEGVTGGTTDEEKIATKEEEPEDTPPATPARGLRTRDEDTLGPPQEPEPALDPAAQRRATRRRAFAARLRAAAAVWRYDEDVAELAEDENLVGELETAAAELTEFAGKVRAAHDARLVLAVVA